RFLQRDPFGGFAGDPQSLNGFSYAFNNPLRYADRSGMAPEIPGTPPWASPGPAAPEPLHLRRPCDFCDRPDLGRAILDPVQPAVSPGPLIFVRPDSPFGPFVTL